MVYRKSKKLGIINYSFNTQKQAGVININIDLKNPKEFDDSRHINHFM